jgi:hypothetical protein
MRITEHTPRRLVVEGKPRIASGVFVGLGAIALLASLHSLVVVGRPVSEQSGSASRVSLLLTDRALPLMLDFTANRGHETIQRAIQDVLGREDS